MLMNIDLSDLIKCGNETDMESKAQTTSPQLCETVAWFRPFPSLWNMEKHVAVTAHYKDIITMGIRRDDQEDSSKQTYLSYISIQPLQIGIQGIEIIKSFSSPFCYTLYHIFRNFYGA